MRKRLWRNCRDAGDQRDVWCTDHTIYDHGGCAILRLFLSWFPACADNPVTAVDLVSSRGPSSRPAAGIALDRALSELMALRFAYLAVLRVFSWLTLLACSDRAKDAEILLRLLTAPTFGSSEGSLRVGCQYARCLRME